jgi:hypothetical protein
MCGIGYCLILVVILLIWWYRSERVSVLENLTDIPIRQMTATDITNLRTYIEKAVRLGQFYGDFRRMYPYPITPWQYNTMIASRKLGELDDAKVKNILSQ